MNHNATIGKAAVNSGLPRLALSALLLAILALLLLLTAGTGTRLGLWQFRTGFTILKYGAACGGLAGVTAAAAIFIYLRQRRLLGTILALSALTAGIIAVALPLSWKSIARKVPPIHDISTDTSNPPLFSAILPLRQGAPNQAGYGGPAIAAKQQAAYPDIKPLVLGMPPGEAFPRAEATARAMGWQIIASDAGQGRIEATATTFWFGFVDDVVIRLTPAGERTIIDIRSVSRVGISDVGTNAKRIRTFLQKLAGGR